MTSVLHGGRRHAVFHPLRVERVERLTADAVAVTFAVPPALAADYAFDAGQHLTVRRPGGDVRRNYSICVPPSAGVLRVAIKRLPGGEFSTWAGDGLVAGDVLEVMTPTGRFGAVLRDAGPVAVCAVAAGSGITPVISLLQHVLGSSPLSTATLVYANRTAGEVMFLDELADVKDRWPARFRLLHVLSRERQESELLSGRLDGSRLGRILDALVPVTAIDEWFLCGPYGLVTTARSVLLERGVDGGRVHTELFHVEGEGPREPVEEVADGAEAAHGRESTVTVLLDSRRTTVPVARSGRSVLDAVLAVRPDAPYACKGGVCGTCRARVLEGEVRMDRYYALEPAEVAEGFVLACQSHPLTDTVTLDFDA